MSRVLRRLEKLEARLTDRSHLTPHSQEWFDYWRERLDRCLVDGDDKALAGMPVEFYRAMTELAVKEEEAERARQVPINEDGNSSNRQA
ncbi:MAG: hypothetical protein ACLQU1_24980 [Bryobacteraceae bacterium]